ncbi:S41 family peptidase [Lacticaseibacillus hulanensis]|uniref:S41 family peptidase n=1 Tax=Lacticaseibacillus hulanensis TaxID=2493111 RepID=UPI003BA99B89
MVLTVVGLAIGGVAGYVAKPTTQTVTLDSSSIPKNFQKVLTTYTTIRDNYVTKPSDKKLVDGAINGMIKSLDDPFSNYLQDTDATSLNTEISGSFGGIGATMVQTADGVQVDSVNPGSAAQKAGVKANDKIVKVDGKDMSGKDINKVVAKIRGKIGSTVTVVVERDNKQLTFTMKRAKVTVPSVSGKIDQTNKQIGVITFTTFTETSAKQIKSTVKKLRKQGANKFILDLRGNPGGVLDQALQIDSMFLKDGQVMLKVDPRKGKTEIYRAGSEYDGGFKIKEPTVVLIDGNSASASEITAAALNESAGIKLIGTKSFGKGTVQTVAQMGKNAELKLTIAKWLTPEGQWIHHKGIQPTIKADYPSYAYINTISAASLKQEQVSSDVKSLQKILVALGYQIKSVNGYYGSDTAAAVKAFQTKNNLSATGTADSKTLAKLQDQISDKISANDNAMKKAEQVLK